MNRIAYAMIEVGASAICVIPIFFIYERVVFHNIKKGLLSTVFAFYLVAVLALVGFPDIASGIQLDVTINLIPFVGMVSDFKNALLNVILFVPMGMFLPILSSKFRELKTTLIVSGVTILVIEVMQLVTFRTTDINDVITNLGGTWLGYFITKLLTKNFTKYTIQNTKTAEVYMIYGTVFLIMFFVQPFISSWIWELLL